ncbi:MAG: SUMF1/EgtB/PvdO family nonheme iron enzyme [Byssovorax sp.]
MPRALLAALLAGLCACRPGSGGGAPDAGLDGAPPWAASEPEPPPRPGMVFIPGGVLIAGTPPERLPRVPDEEMAGEQVVMHGFYVDVFPYPDEVGAIPTTNLTRDEARELCENQGKRLCTELELERACKGPDNHTYEYGDVYKPAICGTGVARALIPNGYNTSCKSAFGASDLHGGVWVWTSSAWNRGGDKQGLVAQRGGNGTAGELVGRCANGRGMKPGTRKEDVGVRCCAGEPNTFEVVLSVTRGEPLRWVPSDEKIAPQLEKLLPAEVRASLPGQRPEDQFKVERVWVWHPLGNEELWIGGGCARVGGNAAKRRRVTREGAATCGVLIGRIRGESPTLLTFVPSDWWTPTLAEGGSARELLLRGGDRNGAFHKRISYAWGRIAVGDKERSAPSKGERDPGE